MPIKGVKRVRERIKQELKEIADKKTAEVLWRVGMIGGGYAALLTPVDTSFLINSQYQEIDNTPAGMQLRLGYTARYAEWVHDMPGKLKGQPRENFGRTSDGVEFGGGTGNGEYWDPNAEPEFLRKGIDENLGEITREIERGYQI
ncbi:hypothetical protein AM272_05375 [Escherichia coli]|uniref:hypothetical protein n=1 Tax=Escherichia coli TaxID=562 RepID=UPI00070783BF|nr:hypothetical protein [Escherichia coli]KQJ43136.1 hypothetical protein AM272_05375 [Escherichia coli]HAW7813108.1 hypothetical protein [Escherichia coli]